MENRDSIPQVRGIVFTGWPEEDQNLFSRLRMRRGATIGAILGGISVTGDIARGAVPAFFNQRNPLEDLSTGMVIAEVVVVLTNVAAGAILDGFRPTSRIMSAIFRTSLAGVVRISGGGRMVVSDNNRVWLE